MVILLEQASEKSTYFTWHYFCLLCSLKQPTEKPTIEKSSAAKDPTDPPSKGEEYQDETVSEKEDPITKGVYT